MSDIGSNGVPAVLVLGSANATPLAAGSSPAALSEGQLGIFSSQTGLSVTTSTTTGVFFATKLPDGTIIKSKGDIRPANLVAATTSCYVAGTQGVVRIGNGFCAKCDQAPGIKISVITGHSRSLLGYAPLTKSYYAAPECCTGEGDAGEVFAMLQSIRDQINNDPDKLFTAALLSGADGSTVIANENTYDPAATGQPYIRITANAEAVTNWVGFPYMTANPVGVMFDAAAVGFGCCGDITITKTTPAVYRQNSGYVVRFMEWDAAFNQGLFPHRTMTAAGVTFTPPMNSVAATNYDIYTFQYYDPIVTGGIEYPDPKLLFLAVPTGGTSDTISSVVNTVLGTSLTDCTANA